MNGHRLVGKELRDLLPQKPPFVLLDAAEVDIEAGRVRGWKGFGATEELLPRDRAGRLAPSLLVECMGQAAIVLMRSKGGGGEVLLGGLNGLRFGAFPRTGSLVEIEVEIDRPLHNGVIFRGRVLSEGRVLLEAERMIAVDAPGGA